MTQDRSEGIERTSTRRSMLKAGLVVSMIGIGGTATGMANADNSTDEETTETDGTSDDSETYTLTLSLMDPRDAGIISGDVTVDGRTKTTKPLNGDPARIQATFELENGTYTLSGSADISGEIWHTEEKEVTIDGEDEAEMLVLQEPGDDDADTETYTVTAYLVESEDADIVSGEVTVDGQTKATTAIDPHVHVATFELPNGTYPVSGRSDAYPDWRTKDREFVVDGSDRDVELFLYPPDSDELDDGDGSDTPDDEPDDTGDTDTPDGGTDETDETDETDTPDGGTDETDETDETDTPNEESDDADETGDDSEDPSNTEGSSKPTEENTTTEQDSESSPEDCPADA